MNDEREKAGREEIEEFLGRPSVSQGLSQALEYARSLLAAVDEFREACLQEHGGKHHEPECPICAVLSSTAHLAAKEERDVKAITAKAKIAVRKDEKGDS